MKISKDEKGIIRLMSSGVLSDDVKARIAKRIEKKKETLDTMKADVQNGKFSAIIASL